MLGRVKFKRYSFENERFCFIFPTFLNKHGGVKGKIFFIGFLNPRIIFQVLILDSCTWLTCSFLISVAKYKNLEIISVVNCPRIHLHTVPYLNVAKYGLKKLKVFDCRFTGIMIFPSYCFQIFANNSLEVTYVKITLFS